MRRTDLKTSRQNMDTGKVLIVDDNTAFCQALGKILKSRYPSISVEEAHGGSACLRKVEAFLPHLVFVDPRLLKQDIPELIPKIKDLRSATIVVIFGDYDLPEHTEAIQRSGADYYFQRDSWTGTEILSLVQTVLTQQDVVPSACTGELA